MEAANLNLRQYQTEAIQAIENDWQSGYSDTLLTMATGGGKTVVFIALIDRIMRANPKARVLILAHRTELIEQPIEKIAQFLPHLLPKVGVVMAERNQADAQIVVATVQTMSSPVRLAEVLSYGPFDNVITDEAHHAAADSYVQVYRTLKDWNPNLRHVGVTATPMRSDDKSLGLVFQKQAATYDIRRLLQLGYLVPPRWLAISTAISLAGVARANGDFVQKQLADVFETSNCFDLVVESHKKYAGDRQSIAFVVSVKGAYDLAQKFNDAGIPAAAADGTVSKAERREILKSFRDGKTRVLVNCALWTEGLDVPEIACAHMVRPTGSDSLYVQMIGRALRPVIGKTDALILEYCPAETRNIVGLGDVLGVEAKKEVYQKEGKKEGEILGGFTFDGKDVKWLNGSPMELISRQIDYFGASPWQWGRDPSGYSVLGLGEASDGIERTLVISPVADSMKLFMVAREKFEKTSRCYEIKTGSLEDLTQWAEEYAEKRGNAMLAAKQKAWRKQPASDAQIDFARRLKVWDPSMTKGECAEAITRCLALRELRKAGMIK